MELSRLFDMVRCNSGCTTAQTTVAASVRAAVTFCFVSRARHASTERCMVERAWLAR